MGRVLSEKIIIVEKLTFEYERKISKYSTQSINARIMLHNIKNGRTENAEDVVDKLIKDFRNKLHKVV